MRILITGGAGFIGANLCNAALARGHQVSVLDDFSTGRMANLDDLPVALTRGSVLDPAALAAASDGVDAIVHLAAQASVPRSIDDPERTRQVNVEGTACVLDAAAVRGCHVVFASTCAVYGDSAALPIVEEAPADPVSPYAVSKLDAESLVLDSGLDACVFRLFNVYGPHQPVDHAYAAVVPAFLDAILHGRSLTVYGDGEQSRDFVSASFVVDVVLTALESRLAYGGPVNVAAGTRTSVNELITALETVTGRVASVVRTDARVGDVRDSHAAIDLLRSLVPSVSPESLESGLRRTHAWWVAQ